MIFDERRNYTIHVKQRQKTPNELPILGNVETTLFMEGRNPGSLIAACGHLSEMRLNNHSDHRLRR